MVDVFLFSPGVMQRHTLLKGGIKVPMLDRFHVKLLSGLTLLTTFLMGAIDAYTFIEQDGSFASAQTGNLVVLSIKIFSGQFHETSYHIFSFIGYALGAFIGEVMVDQLKDHRLYSIKRPLQLKVLVLAGIAIFQPILPHGMKIFFLGLLAGYALSVYRKFNSTTVNNGIMTGNTKNMMNQLYLTIFKKDQAAKQSLAHFLLVLLVFMAGAGVSTMFVQLNPDAVMWFCFILILLALVLLEILLAQHRKD